MKVSGEVDAIEKTTIHNYTNVISSVYSCFKGILIPPWKQGIY